MADKKIGIILVGYKDYARRFLADCRDSLRGQTYPSALIKVSLVENCSPDAGRFVKDNFPEAHWIGRSDGNYAAANNVGLAAAARDGCDYFFIANLDVVFDRQCLTEMAAALAAHPRAGLVQAKILLYPKNDEDKKNPKINSLGNIAHFLGFAFTDGYQQPDRFIGDHPLLKGYASGCAFMLRRSVYESLGGEEEQLYMYHDDLEYSLRAKISAYEIRLAPRAIVYHKYEFSRSLRMLSYMERNRYLIMLYYYRWPTLLLLAPAWAAMDAGMLFFALASGWGKEKLAIYLFFLRPSVWQRIAAKRKLIRRIRLLTDRALLSDFSGRIEFQEVANPLLTYVANPLFNIYWQIVKHLIFW